MGKMKPRSWGGHPGRWRYDFERDPYKNEYIDLGYAFDPGLMCFICHRCYQLFRFSCIQDARDHRNRDCR